METSRPLVRYSAVTSASLRQATMSRKIAYLASDAVLAYQEQVVYRFASTWYRHLDDLTER